jgi:hypothetical protein
MKLVTSFVSSLVLVSAVGCLKTEQHSETEAVTKGSSSVKSPVNCTSAYLAYIARYNHTAVTKISFFPAKGSHQLADFGDALPSCKEAASSKLFLSVAASSPFRSSTVVPQTGCIGQYASWIASKPVKLPWFPRATADQIKKKQVPQLIQFGKEVKGCAKESTEPLFLLKDLDVKSTLPSDVG